MKQKNLDTKYRPVKKSKLGQSNLGEADVEGIGTTFVGERDTPVRGTDESGSMGSTTPSGSDSTESGGKESTILIHRPIWLTQMPLHFSVPPSDLSFVPSFRHHVLLDIWRNKVSYIWND
ncbi:hypothetical protein Scep_024547 [Stephania cephalantha]|uniref:Uncharacterized protein n=1 Tax=Stephania cephalantha TaxID=152367 RepID=A0AAP0F296_9MAGN